MKWIYIPTFITKEGKNLNELHADLMCTFTEFYHEEWLSMGIRACKKLCEEINKSKTKLKVIEKELNTLYKTNYKIVTLLPSETGCYWNYNSDTYMFPQ